MVFSKSLLSFTLPLALRAYCDADWDGDVTVANLLLDFVINSLIFGK